MPPPHASSPDAAPTRRPVACGDDGRPQVESTTSKVKTDAYSSRSVGSPPAAMIVRAVAC
jgi:hypothetical protein